ncbi:hypothetical protein V1525DRAFT_2959 [Lipomyces kononenkoae]|uniref:Uncharacterized protein n=1 Tax=Lipomyces kononenkoae TaxID=34357 RepID=A0ACC3TBC5_LIPKO
MTIRVALIGAGSGPSAWAWRAHIPAFKELTAEKYDIVGILNSSLESSKTAIDYHGLTNSRPFQSIEEVIQSHADIVIVSVKVPDHFRLAEQLVQAGKNTFVEWPLGNGFQEAKKLTELAQQQGVRTAVGLQSRNSASILKAKELIATDKLGTVISTSFVGYTPNWGPRTRVGAYPDYLGDVKNGANLLTIPGGHALDAIRFVLGKDYSTISAKIINNFPKVEVIDTDGKPTGEFYNKSAPDQVLIIGTFAKNIPFSFHLIAGQGTELSRKLTWTIHGTLGDLLIEGPSGYTELNRLTLSFTSIEKPTENIDLTPEEYNPVVDNVKHLWQEYSKGHSGKQGFNFSGYPTFEDALELHKILDDVLRSSETGESIRYDD